MYNYLKRARFALDFGNVTCTRVMIKKKYYFAALLGTVKCKSDNEKDSYYSQIRYYSFNGNSEMLWVNVPILIDGLLEAIPYKQLVSPMPNATAQRVWKHKLTT